MYIEAKMKLNEDMGPNDSEVASGWVELNGCIKFPVKARKYKDHKDGKEKMFISYPQKKKGDRYEEVVSVSNELKEEIYKKVWESICFSLDKDSAELEIDEVKVSLFEQTQNSAVMLRGMATIKMEGVTISGIQIKESSKGLFVQMPQHKSQGQYKDSVYGSNTIMQRKIKEKVLEAYQKKVEQKQEKEQIEQPEKTKGVEQQAPWPEEAKGMVWQAPQPERAKRAVEQAAQPEKRNPGEVRLPQHEEEDRALEGSIITARQTHSFDGYWIREGEAFEVLAYYDVKDENIYRGDILSDEDNYRIAPVKSVEEARAFKEDMSDLGVIISKEELKKIFLVKKMKQEPIPEPAQKPDQDDAGQREGKQAEGTPPEERDEADRMFQAFQETDLPGIQAAFQQSPFELEKAEPAALTPNAVKSQCAALESGNRLVVAAFINNYDPGQATPLNGAYKQSIKIDFFENGTLTGRQTLLEKESRSPVRAARNYNEVLRQWKDLTGQEQIRFSVPKKKEHTRQAGQFRQPADQIPARKM